MNEERLKRIASSYVLDEDTKEELAAIKTGIKWLERQRRVLEVEESLIRKELLAIENELVNRKLM